MLVFSKDSCESLGRQDHHRAGFLGRLPGSASITRRLFVRRFVSFSIVRSTATSSSGAQRGVEKSVRTLASRWVGKTLELTSWAA